MASLKQALNPKTSGYFQSPVPGINVEWSLKDDVSNPFGDKRQALVIVFTFDLDSDVLRFVDASQSFQLSLSRFRERRPPVILREFNAFEPPSPPVLNPLAFPSPHWTPSQPVSFRPLPFVTRILTDFAHQWRHILRSRYADSTFRKLAHAILRIASLDFKIVEAASRWQHTSHHGNSGPYVWIHDLPPWQPCEEHCFRLGRTTIVLVQDLEHAMALVREDVAEKNDESMVADGVLDSGMRRSKKSSNTYLLLSVRHVALCRADDGQGTLSYTAPLAFLNGIDTPSLAAVELLLQSLSIAFPPQSRTRIHSFPTEIQDRVLEQVSESLIEDARLGCLLDVGSSFGWMRKDKTRRAGPIERHTNYTHRGPKTPVESWILFGETLSGVAYR